MVAYENIIILSAYTEQRAGCFSLILKSLIKKKLLDDWKHAITQNTECLISFIKN